MLHVHSNSQPLTLINAYQHFSTFCSTIQYNKANTNYCGYATSAIDKNQPKTTAKRLNSKFVKIGLVRGVGLQHATVPVNTPSSAGAQLLKTGDIVSITSKDGQSHFLEVVTGMAEVNGPARAAFRGRLVEVMVRGTMAVARDIGPQLSEQNPLLAKFQGWSQHLRKIQPGSLGGTLEGELEVHTSLEQLEKDVAANPDLWCAGSGPNDPPYLSGLDYELLNAGELTALLLRLRGVVLVQLAVGWAGQADGAGSNNSNSSNEITSSNSSSSSANSSNSSCLSNSGSSGSSGSDNERSETTLLASSLNSETSGSLNGASSSEVAGTRADGSYTEASTLDTTVSRNAVGATLGRNAVGEQVDARAVDRTGSTGDHGTSTSTSSSSVGKELRNIQNNHGTPQGSSFQADTRGSSLEGAPDYDRDLEKKEGGLVLPAVRQPVFNPGVLTLLDRAAARGDIEIHMSPAMEDLGLTAVLCASQQPFSSWGQHLASFGCQAALLASSPYYKMMVGRILGYKEENILHHIKVTCGKFQPSPDVVRAVDAKLKELSSKKPTIPWGVSSRGKAKAKTAVKRK